MKLDFISDINKDYGLVMNYSQVDRFIVKIQWWMFVGLLVLTFLNSIIKIFNFYPSPFSWRVISLPEAAGAIVFGFIAALVPMLLRGKIKNHYAWRVMITFTLNIFSYLFVFISGGSIEMHFMFFAVIALVVIYSDWRLGWILFLLVVLHHGILNYTDPSWVFYYGRNDFAVFAHAVPVIVAVIFTTILTNNQRDSILLLIKRKKDYDVANQELQASNQQLDSSSQQLRATNQQLVAGEKTLREKIAELEIFNKVTVGRELKMVELKKEIEELRKKIGNS